MGVSISWHVPKKHDVTPGARSKAAALLRDDGLVGELTSRDHATLIHLAAYEEDNEIRKMLVALAAALEKHGEIVVTLDY